MHARSPQSSRLFVLALLAWRGFGRLRLSMVCIVHDPFYDYKLRNQAMVMIALVLFTLDIFYRRAACDRLPNVWNWMMGDLWWVVQNDADNERLDRDSAAGSVARYEGKTIVIPVGHLEKVKDPVALLHTFAPCTGVDIYLVFIGAGPVEAEPGARVISLGLENRVILTGLIQCDEVFVRCWDHVAARFTPPIMHAGTEAVYRELPRFVDTRRCSP